MTTESILQAHYNYSLCKEDNINSPLKLLLFRNRFDKQLKELIAVGIVPVPTILLQSTLKN